MAKIINLINLGLINYKMGWEIQEKYFNDIITIKKENFKLKKNVITPNYIILCEHKDVYTIGTKVDQNIKSLESKVINKRIEIYHINRGGSITFHNPGQVVIYPILNLDYFFRDINKYLRILEECVIRVLLFYGIKAQQREGFTGVWVWDLLAKEYRKICSIGIRASYWTTMHGLALNVNNDLENFNNIDPCGLEGVKVTSMKEILHENISLQKIFQQILSELKYTLGAKIISQQTKHMSS